MSFVLKALVTKSKQELSLFNWKTAPSPKPLRSIFMSTATVNINRRAAETKGED